MDFRVGQRVKFKDKVHTITQIRKPLGTYETYQLERHGVNYEAFRYQLEPNYDFDSDDDYFLGQIELGEVKTEPVEEPETSDSAARTGRFGTATDEDLDNIDLGRHEKNTNKQTSWGVRLFKEWCLSSSLSADFESLAAEDLNCLLRRFYVEARTRTGQTYSKSALVGIRAALNRHLSSPPFGRMENLMKDAVFTSSNHVLFGVLKQQERDGKDVTTHKEAISSGDLVKLYNSDTFSLSNPLGLLRKVWFDIEFHFGRRGLEGPL